MKFAQARPSILIVDDSGESTQTLVNELGGHYRIILAVDGNRALNAARAENPPDLILLGRFAGEWSRDLMCKRIIEDERLRQIRILVLLDEDHGEEEKSRAIKAGAGDVLTRPFNSDIILARVKTHMEWRHYRSLVENVALLDQMTGIWNKGYLEKNLDKEWRRVCRRGDTLSLILAEIDFFDEFRKSFGPEIGDDCLRQIAMTLTDTVRRPADFVTYYNGGCFAAVLPETEEEPSRLMAELMRRRIQSLEIEHADNPTNRVTLSLGVATTKPLREAASKLLIDAAEKMLEDAKKNGPNKVQSTSIS